MRPSPRLRSVHSRSQSATTQDLPSPVTPDACFSPGHTPAIASPDEFTLQIDVQLGSPHKSPITHPPDPRFLSGDDASKAQVLLRNAGRRRNMYEGSPPLRTRVLPWSQDDLPWEAAPCSFVDQNQVPEPSRYSLLIQEVSLLVGLTTDDETPSSDDGCPLLPDPPKLAHDVLPLNLGPTRSLTSRKHRKTGLPPSTNVQACSSEYSISPCLRLHAGHVSSIHHNQVQPAVRPNVSETPIPRPKTASSACPSLSPHRRQGQVFHFEPPPGNASHRNAVDLDEMFSYPRKPPPRPTHGLPANRCSSLDRLERSLLKLEAHAPVNHRKSRSEGRPSNYVAQRQDIRPALPPPPPLKQLQSSHEIMHSNLPRPAHGSGLPSLARRPTPRRHAMPRSYSTSSLVEDPLEEDPIPSSFMDMDIPIMEEARPKRRASSRHLKSKVKVKSLASAAKRVSQGVITWGKSLTGSTKPGAAK